MAVEEELVIQEVKKIRKNHPRIGTRKLYKMLHQVILEHNIKIGRDALFTLLSANNMLIRRRKRSFCTSHSHHWLRKYPNLIQEFNPTSPNQLWVSDITYWKINSGKYLYVSLVTDAYSHKLVGYHVANTLDAVECVMALKMALRPFKGPQSHFKLMHHSDRGVQYCSHYYVKLLQDYNIKISMAENGDPLENAIAERINGIIKEEYLKNYEINNIEEAKKKLDESVVFYNKERPHMSIGNLTPNEIHYAQNSTKTKKLWKNYYKKKDV